MAGPGCPDILGQLVAQERDRGLLCSMFLFCLLPRDLACLPHLTRSTFTVLLVGRSYSWSCLGPSSIQSHWPYLRPGLCRGPWLAASIKLIEL